MTRTYEVEVVPNLLVPCDGYELAADLYAPREAPPGPVLITLLPYNKDWAAAGEYWNAFHYMAAAGYRCLLADFRGTGSSGGVARPPFDAGEGDDGVALVEWAAAQDWCNGRVGMWGASYGGVTALRTASRRPEALKAIVPMITMGNPGRDFLNPAGVPAMLTPLAWGLHNLSLQLTPPLCQDDPERARRVWLERLEQATPYLADIARLSPDDEAWRTRAIAVEDVEVPALCVAGWNDVFCNAMIEVYERLTAPKRLIVGPWMHVMPQDSPHHAVDLLPLLKGWWDTWLVREGGAEREPSATVFTLGREDWTRFETWPGPPDDPVTLDLAADGVLGGQAAGDVTTTADATIGAHAGLPFYSSTFGLTDDQHEDDRRSLAFTGEPLEAAVEILGRVQLRLTLAEVPDHPSPLIAKLADVGPDDRAHPIATGTCRVEAGEVELHLAPTSYEVAAGHRLRVTLATDDFPRLWPDPDARPLSIACKPGSGTSVVSIPLAPRRGRTAVEWATPNQAPPPLLVGEPTARYEVARDLVAGSARVTIEDAQRVRPPHLEGTVSYRRSIRAEVQADTREQAWMNGEARLTVDVGGEPTEIKVSFRAERNSLIADGSVIEGDSVEFERHWEYRRPD